jgi:hypothetical protein
MRIVIHPQHPTFSFQAHLALESNSHFRLTPHWNRTPRSGSFRIGQFSNGHGLPILAILGSSSSSFGDGVKNIVKKCLFVDKGRPEATAVLNWNDTPEREFKFFAEAFHSAAQEAAASLRQNPQFGIDGIPIEDFKVYPVVFLYRHALELYMKAVILIGSPMLAIKDKTINSQQLLTTHNLDNLRQSIERVFDAYGWKWDLGIPHFRSVDDLRETIAELHEIDSKSDTFRYPLDTKGHAALPSAFRFDVFEFCEVLDELLLVFQDAAIGAHEELVEYRTAREE